MSDTKKNLLHCIIMFILTFGIGMLPPIGGEITQLGMKILGVFIGVLYGWTFLGFFWTSCYGMLALCLTGYDTIWNIMGVGFSNMIALQVMSLFILVAYLTDSGFVELVLGFFLTRKIAIGRPFVLIFLIFFACAIVNMFGLGFGGIFFCWAVMYRIFTLLGYQKGDWLVTYMIYGAAVSAGLSNNVFPFAVYPTMCAGFLAPFGVTFDAIPWIVWNFLYVVLFFVAYILVGKYIMRLDVQVFIERAEEVAKVYQTKKATTQQKIAGLMMIVFLIVTLLPSLLPEGVFKTFLNQFGMAGGVFLVITLTSLIYVNGEPLTNWGVNAKNGIAWDLVIMFVATTPIANALESQEAGILSTVMEVTMPILSNMSGALFVVIVAAAFAIITQFAHNLVVIMAFSPMILSIAAEMGNVNMVLLMCCIIISANCAFLTPGASSPAAAVFSNINWVNVKQAYILGIIIIALGLICLAVVAPLGNIML